MVVTGPPQGHDRSGLIIDKMGQQFLHVQNVCTDSSIIASGNLASPRRIIAGLLAQLDILQVDNKEIEILDIQGLQNMANMSS